MVKRKTNRTTYLTHCEGVAYAVTLTRIRNDVCGNPRFEAVVTRLESLNGRAGLACSYVYAFTGHYMDDQMEADWIAKRHHEEAAK